MKNKTAYKNKLMDKKYSDGSWHLRAARNFIALGLTSLLVGAVPFVVQAQKGWHHLFDGKSLSGWKIVGKDADFKVEEGLIVGTMKKGLPNAFLVTEKEYGDFVLEVEFKLEGNTTNSGVQVRSHIDPEGNKGYGRVFGPQVEIDPTPRSWTGGLYDEGRRGWIYPLDLNEKAKSAYKLEEFNTLRIEALGAELRSWVNGVPASHFIDTMRREGIIALQIHSIPDELDGKRVFFRQVRIQTGKFKASPLNPDVYVVNVQPNVLSETEKKAGYNLLFDGNSVGQWRSVKGPDFPDRGWKVSDGALQVLKADGGESTNGGDIITKDRYAVFDLSFEFKLTPGANSGVKYFVTLKEQTQGSAIGLEYQILDDATHPDAKLGRAGNRTLASLYDLITSNREERARRPIGQWNRGRIVVTADNQVFHYLNGMLMLQYKRGSKEFKDLVALSKYKDWEAFGEAATGHILLQDHGDAVSFRSIKVKKIK